MKGGQGGYSLMVSSKQTQERSRVLGGREWQMLTALFAALIERILELRENSVHKVVLMLLKLVSQFASFLCVLIQIMCKQENACMWSYIPSCSSP